MSHKDMSRKSSKSAGKKSQINIQSTVAMGLRRDSMPTALKKEPDEIIIIGDDESITGYQLDSNVQSKNNYMYST